jgi:hypothetical protein
MVVSRDPETGGGEAQRDSQARERGRRPTRAALSSSSSKTWSRRCPRVLRFHKRRSRRQTVRLCIQAVVRRRCSDARRSRSLLGRNSRRFQLGHGDKAEARRAEAQSPKLRTTGELRWRWVNDHQSAASTDLSHVVRAVFTMLAKPRPLSPPRLLCVHHPVLSACPLPAMRSAGATGAP